MEEEQGGDLDVVEWDHISFGVPSILDFIPLVEVQLGGRRFSHGFGSAVPFRWCQWKFSNGGVIEAMDPKESDNFLSRFLKKQQPGIHHVTFKVKNIHQAAAAAKRKGFQILGFWESKTWKEFFLHPKDAMGIVVQIAQSSGDEELGKQTCC